MLNLAKLANQIKLDGYTQITAEAKLCQDVILYLISKSRFKDHITIKGGVVMRSITSDSRRATLDLDIDLIRYPLTDEKIKSLISELNGIEGIKLTISKKIEDLKHQDYHGKRIYLDIDDSFNNHFATKIDLGVHTNLSINQEEYCFDVSFDEDGALLLVNSKEQMLVEKIKSLLRFSFNSTRYKDIFDIFYLKDHVNHLQLKKYFDILIFQDRNIRTKTMKEVYLSIKKTFSNEKYLKRLSTSNMNWIGIDSQIVINDILKFLKSLI